MQLYKTINQLRGMSVDPFYPRSSPHTTYYQSFFILRVPLVINDQPAQISSDDGHLTISCWYSSVTITFDTLTTEVNAVVKKYGLEGVSNYWCEDVPLFELKLSSHENLKRFLPFHSEGKVQSELASRIATMLTQQWKLPNLGAVSVHTEVYMLTPHPERNHASIIQVTSQNLAKCIATWRESKVFDFGTLFRAFRKDHRGVLNQGRLNYMYYEIHVLHYFSITSLVILCALSSVIGYQI